MFFNVSHVFAFETYFSPKDDLDHIVVQEIKKSKTSLDISIYTFRSIPIINAIIEKVQSDPNFKIRVLIRRASMDELVEFLSPLELALKSNGLSLNKLRYVSVTNHHKFIIIDGKILLNSSANFNDSELQATYDENLFVCSRSCPDLVTAFKKEFEYLYEHSHSLLLEEVFNFNSIIPKIQDAEAIKNIVLFSSENFEPVFKAEKKTFKLKPEEIKKEKVITSKTENKKDSAIEKSLTRFGDDFDLGWIEKNLVYHIHQAKKSVKVATGHLRSYTLAKTLAEVSKKGIQVELVLDGQEYLSPEYQAIEDQEKLACMNGGKTKEECVEIGFHFGRWLSDQGVNVLFKYYMVFWNFMDAPQMHHKYMIIDDQTVFAGSYNWSKNAEFRTFENVAITKHPQTVKDYLRNFREIQNYGLTKTKSLYQDLILEWKNKEDFISLLFEPMSLTVSQIDHLRLILKGKCSEVFKAEAIEAERPQDLEIKTQCKVH